MAITDVRVKLLDLPGEGQPDDGPAGWTYESSVGSGDRLLAYCSITLDGAIVIRDVRIIDSPRGPFVAMPSRKLTERCPSCGSKNHLRAKFCNECGRRLEPTDTPRDVKGRPKLHQDIAHPIHADARRGLEQAVIRAFEEERSAAGQPGYRPRINETDEYAG